MKADIGKGGLSPRLRFPPFPGRVQAAYLPAPGDPARPSARHGGSFVPCSCRDAQAQALGWSPPRAGFPSCGQVPLPNQNTRLNVVCLSGKLCAICVFWKTLLTADERSYRRRP